MINFLTLIFLFISSIIKIQGQSTIISKDFSNLSTCLSGLNGYWSAVSDNLSISNCSTSCYNQLNILSNVALLIDTRSTTSGSIKYTYNIGSLTQYAVIGIDLLYFVDGDADLNINVNSLTSKTFNPSSDSLYANTYNVVCGASVKKLKRASLTLDRGNTQLINQELVVTFNKVTSLSPSLSKLGIKKISIWMNCSLNCSQCSNELNCDVCKNGFKKLMLPSGQVVCEQTSGCSSNCYTCIISKTENICTQCQPGYQLSSNICTLIPSIFTCASNEYFDGSNCNLYTSDCLLYNSIAQTYSSSCYGVENFVAYKCIYYSFVIIYQEQNYTSYKCGCDVSNCDECIFSGYCLTCSPGFSQNFFGECYLSSSCTATQYYNTASSSCVNCAGVNCIQCNSTSCLKCTNSSYYIDTSNPKNCLSCNVTNCSQCSSDGKCAICNYGFNLSADSSTCNAPCSSSNCTTCEPGSTLSCQICNSTYTLNTTSKQCVKCNADEIMLSDFTCISIYSCIVNNCQTCVTNDPLHCSACNTNYYQNSDSTQCLLCGVLQCQECENTNYLQCKTCNNNYYLTTNKLECKQCDVTNCQSCEDYNFQLCKICSNNYFLSADKMQCINCQVSNCLQCNTNQNECLTCNKNFYITSDQQCKSCEVADCLQCDTSYNKCLTCNNNFYYSPDQSLCKTCQVLNCKQCDGSYDKCLICDSNFYLSLDKSQCLPCQVSNCLQCDGTFDKCLTCDIDLYLTQDRSQCKPCQVANCQSCDGTYEKCLTCNNYYYPSLDKLNCNLCNVKNCQECSSLNYQVCKTCTNSYYLNLLSTECLPCNVTNCKECQSNNYQSCKVCNDGYNLSINNQQCNKIILPSPVQNQYSIKQTLFEEGYDIQLNFVNKLQQSSLSQSELFSIFSIEISNISKQQYTFTIEQISNLQIKLKIYPLVNIKNSIINVNINDNTFSYQNSISEKEQSQELSPYVKISESQRKAAEQISSVGKGVTTSVLSTIIPAAFFGNFYLICNTLDITGFLYYLIFINIRYPINITNFYSLFKDFSFPFIPNLFEYIINPDYVQTSPPKFMQMNTDNYFIHNSGQYFTIYLAGFGLYLLAKLFARSPIKYLNSYCQRAVKETWEYSGFIDLNWSFYIYMVVGVFIQFNTFNFDDKKSYLVNYIFHSICSFVILGTPFLLFYLIYRTPNISSDSEFLRKYSTLVNGLKLPPINSEDNYNKEGQNNENSPACNNDKVNDGDQQKLQELKSNINNKNEQKIQQENLGIEANPREYYIQNGIQRRRRTRMSTALTDFSEIRLKQLSFSSTNLLQEKPPLTRQQLIGKLSKYYNIILYFRKILFCIVICFLYDQTYLQLGLLTLLNILMIILIAFITPFKSNFDNIQFLIQEVCMIAIQICASLLVTDDETQEEDERMLIGWIIVSISASLIGWFTIFIIKDLLFPLISLIKKLINSNKSSKSKNQIHPLPQSNVKKQQAIFSDKQIIINKLDNERSLIQLEKPTNREQISNFNSQQELNDLPSRKRRSTRQSSFFSNIKSTNQLKASPLKSAISCEQQLDDSQNNNKISGDSPLTKRKSKYFSQLSIIQVVDD